MGIALSGKPYHDCMVKRSPYLTVGEFSLLTRTSRHAVIDWIKRGDIDAHVIPGPRYLIPREEINKLAIPGKKREPGK